MRSDEVVLTRACRKRVGSTLSGSVTVLLFLFWPTICIIQHVPVRFTWAGWGSSAFGEMTHYPYS